MKEPAYAASLDAADDREVLAEEDGWDAKVSEGTCRRFDKESAAEKEELSPRSDTVSI